MIVVVETTFVIEFVIEQEEAAACGEILRLTQSQQIPAFLLRRSGVDSEVQPPQ